ncbi:MAG: hypothetical protein JW995_14280 [Melioribacteraceae bacterium]|nr:hypothetical protein [Melioribacteraceae bacterium]
MKQLKLFLMIILFVTSAINAQQEEDIFRKNMTPQEYEAIFGPIAGKKLNKISGNPIEIKDIIIKGNKIQTKLYNYGSVCAPAVLNDIEDLVWNGLGYGFEFGLMAGAEVIDENGDTLHIISDSHVRSREGDYNADASLKWGWLPKNGYSDPDQKRVASLNAEDADGDGKPDSWPELWYSQGAGKYLWPAFLGDQATAPDEEVFYAIDDYTNYEFYGQYIPFLNDLTKGGLGIDGDVRILQFNNPLAEDIIFMVYQITNASDKDLHEFYMGMYGDPHIGGANDYRDDMANFIPPKGELAEGIEQRSRSMVFGWDEDFKGHGARRPGYFGWKFLESPSFDHDMQDNDDDGINDESPFNSKGNFIDGVVTDVNTGIEDPDKYKAVFGEPKPRWSGDEDGDWDVNKHDIGIDGIGPESVNYPGKDYGEGDGFPSQAWYLDMNTNGLFDDEEIGTLTEEWNLGYKWAGSEPNFGFRDISESDQLGLTGFTAADYNDASNTPRNDERMWQWFTKPEIDPEQPLLRTAGDNVFCFSTGPMMLQKGEAQRFSMAILMGEDLRDLQLNAKTSVQILEADYRFAQPPEKPALTAVPGDGKVTLYWDTKSEESIDPLTSQKDFEGYKIYRSRDYNFSDVYKVTDANGIPYLGLPLFDENTGKAAQFDLVNEYSGLAAVEYEGRGIKYDLGKNTGLIHEYVDSTVTNGITYYYALVAYDRGTDDLPPTETQSVIQEDPQTGELIYDVNTLSVTPGPISVGVLDPEAGDQGSPIHVSGNGTGQINLKVLDKLAVMNKSYKIDFNGGEYYNVLDSTGVSYSFTSKDTVLVALRHKNIVPESVKLYDAENNLVPESEYVINTTLGRIGGRYPNSLPERNIYTINYRYYPVYQSKLYDMEDGNPVFDGIRVFVKDVELDVDRVQSRFTTNTAITVKSDVLYPAVIGSKKVRVSADWEVRWNDTDTLNNGEWAHANVLNTLLGPVNAPFTIWYIERDASGAYYEEPAAFIVQSIKNNGRWDWGEGIVLQPQGSTNATTTYQINFTLDENISNQVLPQEGDVYQLITSKPFSDEDTFLFETKEIEFSAAQAKENVNNIFVIPNPYVAYSISENPGRTLTKRGERELQFWNLPPQCTIRIFTLTGELVDVIEKDDNTSIARWDLLSSEGMRVSYGVYIYHVDIPDVGEKIGRFAIIK